MTTTMTEKTLTVDEPLKVSYCIPEWLKIEQVKLNTATVKGRIAPSYEKRAEPIALVNFGPSLKETWEQVKDFKHVMTCSGAHRFLVEHGIVPTHHLDVDPREHKIGLLGEPQKGVEYLIASTCHPKLFKHLENFDVKLWHIFDTAEEGMRILPAGEWAVTGGCSVGVRTLTLARFLGFTDLHVFGMDGCITDSSHAMDHPNSPVKLSTLEYEGIEYKTTPSMLEAAKNTWHEMDMMKDVTVRFYGTGLIQAMAKNYKRKEVKSALIAFNKPELISAEYAGLNAQLHRENLAYGVGGGKHAETVLKIAKAIETTSILDYGCGKGYLEKAIPFPIWSYDPAIPGKDESPRPADMVVCTDVLEHIEPEKLPFVLDDLRRVTRKVGYFTIHTGPAQKTLADGRNAHLIQQGAKWWTKRLSKFFKVGKVWKVGAELHVVVGRK